MMWNNAGRFCIDRKIPVITEPCMQPADAVAPSIIPEPSVLGITRRQNTLGVIATTEAITMYAGQRQLQTPTQIVTPRKISELQELRSIHVSKIFSSVPLAVWRIFCAVRRQSRVCQDAVLRAVGDTVGPIWKIRDRRKLDVFVAKAGGFRCRVMCSVGICVPGFNFQFRFLDPVYAWACAAKKISAGSPLLFKYDPKINGFGQRLYGTSVACGDMMRLACERVQTRCRCVHDSFK